MHPLEARIDAALRSRDAAFEWVDCDPSLADTAAFCEHYGYSLDDSANAIVVVGKSDPRTYAVCLALATTRLDVNGAVRRRLGARNASFASADETVELTGMEIGGVTPIGLPSDAGLPVWIDAAVVERPQIIIGGGTRGKKLLVPPATLVGIPGAEVVDGLARSVA